MAKVNLSVEGYTFTQSGEDIQHLLNIFKIYDEYERILAENGMSNGQVEETMKFIREKYQELMNGQLKD